MKTEKRVGLMKYDRREMKNKEGKKSKAAYFRKAPLVAGLIVSAAIAIGGCNTKEQVETVNEKKNHRCTRYGNLNETKTVSYTKTVKEGDIACQGAKSPIASPLRITKIGERGIELVYEADIAMGTDKDPIEISYGTSVRLLESDLTPTIKVEKSENAGEAVITVEYSEKYRKYLKDDDFVENYAAKTVSYTKRIDVDQRFPLAAWTGADAKVIDEDVRLIDIDEEGIEVDLGSHKVVVENPPFETTVEIVKIPYGQTLKFETDDAVFKITPKCIEALWNDYATEIIITVETIIPTRVENQ